MMQPKQANAPMEQPSEGQEQASPDEQKQLEQLFYIALEMLHGPKGDTFSDMVRNAQQVTQGIGKATALIMIAVEKKVGQISDEIKWQLGMEIIAELSDLAVQAGALSEDEVSEDYVDEVVSMAYSEYIKVKESMGELDPNELKASVDEANQMMGTQAPQAPQAPQGGGLMGGGMPNV